MMMDWVALCEKYHLPDHVTGVLHCGAHLAEEAADYDEAFGPGACVWWIEANPGVVGQIRETLRPYPNQFLIAALLADVDGEEREFHVTNYDGMSSSLLEFGTHPEFSPDTVFVRHLRMKTHTVDTVIAGLPGIEAINMLVMDLQGAEGMCLAGAKGLLPSIDFVMSEVNKAEVYKGCVKVDELDRVLSDFDRVETLWVSNFGWGDALWVRR